MRDNFYSAPIDCSVLINVMWFGRNAKRFAVACVLLFVTMPSLSDISKNLEQKSNLQTIEQLIQRMVLETQPRSLKYTVVISIRKNLSNVSKNTASQCPACDEKSPFC